MFNSSGQIFAFSTNAPRQVQHQRLGAFKSFTKFNECYWFHLRECFQQLWLGEVIVPNDEPGIRHILATRATSSGKINEFSPVPVGL